MADYSITNVPDGSFWYCRIDGKEIGPLSSGRVKQMARQGKLLREDDVRLGSTGDWVSADDVAGLFAGMKTLSRAEQRAAKAEADAAEHSEPHHLREPSPLADAWDALRDRFSGARDSFAVFRAILSAVCLMAVGITLVIIVGQRMALISLDWSDQPDPYPALQSAFQEFKELRAKSAGPDEWKTFSEQTSTQLAPLLASLEQQASSKNRLAQQLLWAGRDCWPAMLVEAREEPNEAEQRFETHLANVATLKQGQTLYPSTSRINGSAAFNTTIFLRNYGEHLIAGMLFLDAVLIVWLARWWLKRR